MMCWHCISGRKRNVQHFVFFSKSSRRRSSGVGVRNIWEYRFVDLYYGIIVVSMTTVVRKSGAENDTFSRNAFLSGRRQCTERICRICRRKFSSSSSVRPTRSLQKWFFQIIGNLFGNTRRQHAFLFSGVAATGACHIHIDRGVSTTMEAVRVGTV